MNEATRYLISLAQALAKMSLYADAHPARARAADASFARLRALQRDDPAPTFSFLGREVIYAQRPLHDLADWDWAQRLSGAGVQRLEFPQAVDPESYRAFLEDLLARIALATGPKDRPHPQRLERGEGPIRFGALGVRGGEGWDGAGSDFESMDDADTGFDLSEEADVVSWMHDEVASAQELPLAEAEAVVGSLAQAMHGSARALMPLLTLKEFDQYSTTHALNVAVLAMGLAERLGLSSREVRGYGTAGLLHDLGKVRIPKEILNKPGALTDAEFQVMRSHTVEGARLILGADQHLDLSAVVAFEHHIMIDGGGYPTRCSRRDCHHASKLVHVCDVFDALRTHRPYRVAWEIPAILAYIERRIGTEFDPDVATAFVSMIRASEMRLARAQCIDDEPLVTT